MISAIDVECRNVSSSGIITFSHEGADFYEILNQFEYSRDITLLKQLSIYDLIDFLEQDILINEEYTAFMSSLTAIEIVSSLNSGYYSAHYAGAGRR